MLSNWHHSEQQNEEYCFLDIYFIISKNIPIAHFVGLSVANYLSIMHGMNNITSANNKLS
jgi:hypothetical protein